MNWLTQFLNGLVKPFKCWVVVAPWERAVRVRLGKRAIELRPGFHWRIPFLDRIYVQSVRLRTVAETNQTVSTKDGRTVVVSIALRFCVRDMLKLYDTLSNPEVSICQLALAATARIITRADSWLLSPRPRNLPRERDRKIPSVGASFRPGTHDFTHDSAHTIPLRSLPCAG